MFMFVEQQYCILIPDVTFLIISEIVVILSFLMLRVFTSFLLDLSTILLVLDNGPQ